MTAPVGFSDLSWAGGVLDAALRITFLANGALQVRTATLAPDVAIQLQKVVGGDLLVTSGKGLALFVVPSEQEEMLLKIQPYLRYQKLRDAVSNVLMWRATGGKGKRQDQPTRQFRERLREREDAPGWRE